MERPTERPRNEESQSEGPEETAAAAAAPSASIERIVRTMICRVPGAALLVAVLASPAAAQQPSPSPQVQQPLANTPFAGSVPKGTASEQPLRLSLKDTVQRALQNNLGLLLQEEAETSARGARWRALADLLPNVSGGLTERRQVINLEAFGFKANPPVVGPFNIYDARVYLSQPLVDLSALNDARAATLNAQAAKYGIKTARDLVVLVAVNLYLESIAAESRVEMTRAQQDTADALLKQAQDLKTAGLVAGIDVLRAQVQLQTERQRVIAAENESQKTKLQLARAIGIPVAQPVVLTDRIPYAPMPPLTLDEALKRAFESRADYLEAQTRVESARAAERAATAALLPSLHFDADYGDIGQTFGGARRTYSLAANVRIPLFDAGRTTARRIEASSALRQREAELADFKGRIEYDVRAAFLDVRTAEQQLQAAQTNVQLAKDEIQQARDRFAAGVASNLEITQAQETLATANDTYVNALYAHNIAKATLARALGIAESAVMGYLGGLQ
jgi:outer membrane protein TolC